jgi:hypothetical protein
MQRPDLICISVLQILQNGLSKPACVITSNHQ